MSNEIPTFTPPAPTFVPPQQSSSNGNSCYYHQNEQAVAKCAKCGKPICQDCYDTYQVTSGEYAGKALCYDCCQEIVAENVKELKKQRRTIIFNYIFTALGMALGGIIGGSIVSSSTTHTFDPTLIVLLCVFIGGCAWTFALNVLRVAKYTLEAMSNGEWLGAVFGLVLGFLKSIFLAVWGTIRKLFYYTKYIIKTSGFIKSDSNCLQEMKDYMEYTMVRSRNVGVDLATLMNEGSELYNNSYAQAVAANGEENAESRIRNCVTSINENGEIIRSFAA